MTEAPYPPAEPPADGDRTNQVPPNPRFSASASVPMPPPPPEPAPFPASFSSAQGPGGATYGGMPGSPYSQGTPYGQPSSNPPGGGQFDAPPPPPPPPAASGQARVAASASVPAPTANTYGSAPAPSSYSPAPQTYSGPPGVYGQPGPGQYDAPPPGGGQFDAPPPPPPGGGGLFGQPPAPAPAGPPPGGNSFGAPGGTYGSAAPSYAPPPPPPSGPGGPGGPGGGQYGGGVYGQPGPSDRGREPQPQPMNEWTSSEAAERKPKRGLIIVLIAAAIVVVVAVGGYVGFRMMQGGTTYQTGTCVQQSGNGAKVVDCSTNGAFKIKSIVDGDNTCPDANQPSLVLTDVAGKKQYACLAPANS